MSFFCEVVGQRRDRIVCEALCKRRKLGKLDKPHSKCSAAIGKRRCSVVNEMFPKRVRKNGEA